MSASGLGGILHHNCELFAHRSVRGSHRPLAYAASGDREHEPAVRATFAAGFEHEKLVTESVGAEDCSKSSINEALFKAVVDQLPVSGERYLYHLRFTLDDKLLAMAFPGLQAANIKLASMEPDLLKVTLLDPSDTSPSSVRILSIIDMKSSARMKNSHQVQIAVYHLALAAEIANHADPAVRSRLRLDANAGVWLPGSEGPEWFQINFVIDRVRDYLNNDLPRIVLAPDETKLQWHYTTSCAGCDSNDRCRQAALATGDLSSIPFLSVNDKKFLLDLLHSQASPQQPAALAPEEADIASLSQDTSAMSIDDRANAAGSHGQMLASSSSSSSTPGNAHMWNLASPPRHAGVGVNGFSGFGPGTAGSGGGGGAGQHGVFRPGEWVQAPPPQPSRLTDIEALDQLLRPGGALHAQAASGQLPVPTVSRLRRILHAQLPEQANLTAAPRQSIGGGGGGGPAPSTRAGAPPAPAAPSPAVPRLAAVNEGSPVLQAILKRQIRILNRPNYDLARPQAPQGAGAAPINLSPGRGQVRGSGSSSDSQPAGDFCVFISLLTDPLTKQVAGYALRCVDADNKTSICPTGAAVGRVDSGYVITTVETLRREQVRLIQKLYECLTKHAGRRVQVYVWDEAQRCALTDLCVAAATGRLGDCEALAASVETPSPRKPKATSTTTTSSGSPDRATSTDSETEAQAFKRSKSETPASSVGSSAGTFGSGGPAAAIFAAPASAASGVERTSKPVSFQDMAEVVATTLVAGADAVMLPNPSLGALSVDAAPKSSELKSGLLQRCKERNIPLGDKETCDSLKAKLRNARKTASGAAPLLCVVQTAMRGLLALPGAPGWYELDDAARILDVPTTLLTPRGTTGSSSSASVQSSATSQSALYQEWYAGTEAKTKGALGATALMKHATLLHDVTVNVKERVMKASPALLPTTAMPLSVAPSSTLNSAAVRRMLFVKQYEILSDWRELRAARSTGSGMARLRFEFSRRTVVDNKVRFTSEFTVLQGSEYLSIDNPPKERFSYLNEWILASAADIDGTWINGTPIASAASGSASAGTSSSSCSAPLPPLLAFEDSLFYDATELGASAVAVRFAAIVDLKPNARADGLPVAVLVVQHEKEDPLLQLQPGATYVLGRRSVDRTLPRACEALARLDRLKCVPLMLKLLEPATAADAGTDAPADPDVGSLLSGHAKDALHAVFSTYKASRDLATGALQQAIQRLLPTASQKTAIENVARNRLALIWGPPGTGKTHALALIVLYMVAATWLAGNRPDSQVAVSAVTAMPRKCLKVAIVACTHRAVDEVMQRIRDLHKLLKEQVQESYGGWRDEMIIHKHDSGDTSVASTAANGPTPCVIGGTVWAISKLHASCDGKFDILMVDEGSQLLAADAAIVSSLLAPGGRLVVAGDHLQLAPVQKVKYPSPSSSSTAAAALESMPVQGSILECMRAAAAIIAASQAASSSGSAGAGATASLSSQASSASSQPAIKGLEAQLFECYRMNEWLCSFSKPLYGRKYQSDASIKDRKLYPSFGTVATGAGGHGKQMIAVDAVRSSLLDHKNGYRAILKLSPPAGCPSPQLVVRQLLTAEADVAAEVVRMLLLSVSAEKEGKPLLCSDIFVVTPHRNQRAAVQAALTAIGIPVATDKPAAAAEAAAGPAPAGGGHSGSGAGTAAGAGSAPSSSSSLAQPNVVAAVPAVCVDTVERMQGREAEVVVLCYGYHDPEVLANEADFIYDRNRLNVAVTRARRGVVLLVAETVLKPPLSVLEDARRRDAVEYMHRLVYGDHDGSAAGGGSRSQSLELWFRDAQPRQPQSPPR